MTDVILLLHAQPAQLTNKCKCYHQCM